MLNEATPLRARPATAAEGRWCLDLLEKSAAVDVLPESFVFTRSTQPGPRILHLSGTWRLGEDQTYGFRATIHVEAGEAEGIIDWQPSGPSHLAEGTEQVRGSVESRGVELEGYKTDRGLTPDLYRIDLLGGDDAGEFEGSSRAFGGWDGFMAGTYWFVRESRTAS